MSEMFEKALLSHQQGDIEHAKKVYQETLKIEPNHISALTNLGIIYKNEANWQEAEACYQKALAIEPNFPDAWNNLGVLYQAQGLIKKGIEAFKKAIEYHPNHAQALNNLGIEYKELGELETAKNYFEKAINIVPNFSEAYNNLGNIYVAVKDFEKAIDCFKQAIAINPNNGEPLSKLIHYIDYLCDWESLPPLINKMDALLKDEIAANRRCSETPFMNIMRTHSLEMNYAVAKSWSQDIAQRMLSRYPVFKHAHRQKKKLRLGYVSNDFYDHATMHLMLGYFQQYNQEAFDVFVYAYEITQPDEYTEQVKQAVTAYQDITNLSFYEAASLIYQDGIDILIDLKGYTQGTRLEIFVYRPAPVQISYLGYPGSTGADFIDYMISDKVVSPKEHQPFYSECLIFLPNTYQITDKRQSFSPIALTRQEEGLPKEGIVFCSFNQTLKIDLSIFQVWLKLLQSLPKSVLWLYESHESAKKQLRQVALAHGVAPERLVFAKHTLKARHLSRYLLADIGLDTLQCNGHTTTTDALLAHLPVITIEGEHFSSRVSASLLRAHGVPDLIAKDLTDYYQKAYQLATDAVERKALCQRLKNRLTQGNLFNLKQRITELEQAFVWVWERYQKGLKPEQIDLQTTDQRRSSVNE